MAVVKAFQRQLRLSRKTKLADSQASPTKLFCKIRLLRRQHNFYTYIPDVNNPTLNLDLDFAGRLRRNPRTSLKRVAQITVQATNVSCCGVAREAA